MGKVEGILRSEIVRLAKREIRKIALPVRREVRALKGTVSQLRKALSGLEKHASRRGFGLMREPLHLQASPEEVKASRFSPRLIRALRKRLGVTQKQLATLVGVTVGAIYQWEKGIFEPRDEKKGALVALRKLGRRDVKRLLEEKSPSFASKKASPPRKRRMKKKSRG